MVSASVAGCTSSWARIAALLLAGSCCATALTVNPDDPVSIKSTASVLAADMMSYYTGYRPGDVPGNLPDPYYWWECGAMFGALIDYWHFTGDAQYNDKVTQGMLWQVGDHKDYTPDNQTASLGNDDQGFWGMAAMTAAEKNFPNPPADQPQWLALSQAVFNSLVMAWEPKLCGGGLKWQKVSVNKGWNYRNSIANGILFNLGARLARYTGNQTYADWAIKSWDWSVSVGLINTTDFSIYDGTRDTPLDADPGNCTAINRVQFSYNAGVYLYGAANLYNFTQGSEVWRNRTQGLLESTQYFMDRTKTDIMIEIACELPGNCNNDMISFKAYLSRWMAATTQLAPFTYAYVKQKLRGSALAATAQCTGTVGDKVGRVCGHQWHTDGVWDGTNGVGQQMSVLEVVQNNLISFVAAPVTAVTGGTSKGDPGAGSIPMTSDGRHRTLITTGDKAGAGILTFLSCAGVIGTLWFMLSPS